MRKISLLLVMINSVLCLISSMIFIFLYINNRQGIELIGLFSLFQLLIFPYFFSKYKNNFDIFSPLTIVNGSYFLYLVFTPVSDILMNNLKYFSIEMFPFFRKGILMSIIAIFSLYLGYLFASFLKYSKSKKYIKNISLEVKADKRRVLSINEKLMFVFLLLFTTYTILSGNSWIKFISFGQLGTVNTDMFNKSGLNSYLADTIDCFLAIYLIFCTYTRKYMKYTIMFIPIFAAVITFGFRFRIIMFALAPIIAYCLQNKVRPKGKHVLLGIVVMFIMVGVVGGARGGMRTGQDIDILEIVEFENMYNEFMINNAIYQPFYGMVNNIAENNEFMNGKTFLYLLYHPIPRSIYPNKPEPPVQEAVYRIFKNENIVNSGMAYPNIGEFYINFGTLGVIIGMFIFGIFVKNSYIKINKYPTEFNIVSYSILWPYLLQYVSRGYLVQIVTAMVFLYIPLFIVRKLSYIKIRWK